MEEANYFERRYETSISGDDYFHNKLVALRGRFFNKNIGKKIVNGSWSVSLISSQIFQRDLPHGASRARLKTRITVLLFIPGIKSVIFVAFPGRACFLCRWNTRVVDTFSQRIACPTMRSPLNIAAFNRRSQLGKIEAFSRREGRGRFYTQPPRAHLSRLFLRATIEQQRFLCLSLENRKLRR